jgi:hypothetical protein
MLIFLVSSFSCTVALFMAATVVSVSRDVSIANAACASITPRLG